MRCAQCRHDNPSQAKFCAECGARLAPACAGCGAELAPLYGWFSEGLDTADLRAAKALSEELA